MSSLNAPIQQLLKALHDHSDLIADAMRGPVSTGGRRDKGLESLIRLRALMPVDDDAYYLNPLLREFIGDHMVSFGAFRQLARLDAPLRQLELEFSLLVDFRREGALHDQDQARGRLGDVVVQIGYLMDRNLLLLGGKVTTNFGDVESVAGKIRENSFYEKEVRRFSLQIASLDKKIQFIEGEALAMGLPEVRRLLNVGILSRLPDWSSRIADIQRIVSRNLFTLRQTEARQRNLAAVAMWLAKNRMNDGFDLDISPTDAERLALPTHVPVMWNIDTKDTDIGVAEGILEAAKRLPAPAPVAKPVPSAPPVVRATEQVVVHPQAAPIDELISGYLEFIGSTSTKRPELDFSLLAWRQRHGLALGLETDITDEEWLLYACSEVAAAGLPVRMIARPRRPGEFNDIFTDAYADAHAGARTAGQIAGA